MSKLGLLVIFKFFNHSSITVTCTKRYNKLKSANLNLLNKIFKTIKFLNVYRFKYITYAKYRKLYLIIINEIFCKKKLTK